MAHGPDTERLMRQLRAAAATSASHLFVQFSNIVSLPEELPSHLKILTCNNTRLTRLPSKLPPGLTHLICSHTLITELPELPPTLEILACDNTRIKELPPLPPSLKTLHCHTLPDLTSLPALPASLEYLLCSNTGLTELPDLPSSLTYLLSENVPLILKRGAWHEESVADYNERWVAWREEKESKARCQKRCAELKEDLMAAAWHPSRVARWLDHWGWDALDAAF